MVSENAEDYLACIYVLSLDGAPVKTTEIANSLGISPASVTEMTQKLASEGFLNYEKYKGVTLTQKGMLLAETIKRRHRLLERFFVDVLGMKKEQSHDEAMKLEHTVSDESIAKICQMLNNPSHCPDGDPIPECKEDCADCPAGPSLPLNELETGREACISHLICDDPNKIRRLISMGFVPGKTAIIEEKAPVGGPLLIKINGTRIALAKDYAALIQVHRCNE